MLKLPDKEAEAPRKRPNIHALPGIKNHENGLCDITSMSP